MLVFEPGRLDPTAIQGAALHRPPGVRYVDASSAWGRPRGCSSGAGPPRQTPPASAFLQGLALSCLLTLSGATAAGEAHIVEVDHTCDATRTCVFSVTVRHADEGWDHYADKWEVLGPDGEVLGVRELAHPHVSEQPFTRSLRGVKIPAGVKKVTLRAHDSVHGYGGGVLTVTIPE